MMIEVWRLVGWLVLKDEDENKIPDYMREMKLFMCFPLYHNNPAHIELFHQARNRTRM